MLVNLDGFSSLVDALGGITVNINYYVPVNGDTATGELPDRYFAPGPDQHLTGGQALDFARGRFGLSDYLRMDRQRCVLQAIVDKANPVTLLSRYQELARTTQDIVSTDLPQSVLGDMVDLAFQVKDAGIRSVVFDDTVIDPAYPDYDRMRALVQQALSPATDADEHAGTGTGDVDRTAGSGAGSGRQRRVGDRGGRRLRLRPGAGPGGPGRRPAPDPRRLSAIPPARPSACGGRARPRPAAARCRWSPTAR